ncbi:MAG TPA: hypothetical protein VFV94_21290 [Polyangiaceae bacterium]|nr:hypothetical protein [Polyangiaceae bacterium]
MTTTDRVQKLEALLERVRKNRTAAPRRASAAVAAPSARDAFPAQAPPPQVAPREPFASAVTPPSPPVAPAPTPPSPPTMASTPPDVQPPTTPGWQPEPGSAVQARPATLPPESIPAEEISDDDLVEVTTIPPDAVESLPPVAAAAPAQPSFTEPDEPELTVSEPPAAAPVVEPPVLEPDTMEVSEITAVGVRVSAATLDEALAGAAELEGEALEGEHEVPIKTPPPESGPQEALPPTGLEAARTPDVTELEADLLSPPSMGPTAEQLGETIELEAPRGPELEIDVTVEEPSPASLEPAPAEELEVALPRPSMPSGLYDMTAPPPAAYPDPSLAEGPPSVPEPRETVTIPVEVPSIDSPARTARPALGATDVAHVALAPPASSRSFVELLDASLLA